MFAKRLNGSKAGIIKRYVIIPLVILLPISRNFRKFCAVWPVVKEGDKTYIEEDGTGVTPVVTHNVNMGNFTNQVTVYPLSEYTEDLAAQHDIAQQYDFSFSKENLDNLANEVFGDWII